MRLKTKYQSLTFDKNQTAIIKGFAIIFMIILHVFGGSGWYEKDMPCLHNDSLMKFMTIFKICVNIYVFLVGYGYAFAKQKDFGYSFRHIKKLLACFWLILFCFGFPAGYKMVTRGGEDIVANMFGISSSLCWVNWFVYFYIWAMIILPFNSRIVDRKPILVTMTLMFISYAGMVAVHKFIPNWSKNDFYQALFDCLLQTPLMLLGYLFAHKKWFEAVRLPKHWQIALAGFAVILLSFIVRHYSFGRLDILTRLVYTPMFIMGVLMLFHWDKMFIPGKVLAELGDKSVYMWFLHGLFFTASTRAIYQPFIMISQNLWIIAIWTILLSYLVSAVLKKIVEY